jgi:hypothetical protein
MRRHNRRVHSKGTPIGTPEEEIKRVSGVFWSGFQFHVSSCEDRVWLRS